MARSRTGTRARSRLYGYEEREVVGHNISLLIPEHRRAEDRDLIERVARGERVEHLLTERLRRDGTLTMVSVTAAPIIDAGGALVGVARAATDVGPLCRAEARFRGILEAAPDPMICVDRAGTIARVNAHAERLFGYPREELVGAPIGLLVPRARRSDHEDHVQTYLRDPRRRQMGAGLQRGPAASSARNSRPR